MSQDDSVVQRLLEEDGEEVRLGDIDSFKKKALVYANSSVYSDSQQLQLPEDRVEDIFEESDSYFKRLREHLTAIVNTGEVSEQIAIRGLDQYSIEVETSYDETEKITDAPTQQKRSNPNL